MVRGRVFFPTDYFGESVFCLVQHKARIRPWRTGSDWFCGPGPQEPSGAFRSLWLLLCHCPLNFDCSVMESIRLPEVDSGPQQTSATPPGLRGVNEALLQGGRGWTSPDGSGTRLRPASLLPVKYLMCGPALMTPDWNL